MKLEKNFLKIIRNAAKEKTHAYDTTAEVTRVEGSTAWVHIDGGVAETPAELTISAKVGDKVKVRVSGGRAYLLGNSTAPPTDDRAANVAAVIASKAAFNVKQVQTEQGELRSEVTEECVKKGTSGILSLGSALVQTPSGLDIYSTVNGSRQATHTHIDGDSFDVVKDGVTVASFGTKVVLKNGAGKVSTRISPDGFYISFLDPTDPTSTAEWAYFDLGVTWVESEQGVIGCIPFIDVSGTVFNYSDIQALKALIS